MTDTLDHVEGADATPWFLAGNYAPVADEISATDLDVTGQLPAELNGRYLRNGSNPQSGSSGHWFFGDGMVHGIRLREGNAEWYRNRYVRTTKYDKQLDTFEKMLSRMMGTSGDGLHDRLMDFTRAVSGATFFAPSLRVLRSLAASRS